MPSASTKRKVFTPKPSIMRWERGMPLSLMAHMTMWLDSGLRLTQSQKVSWAVAAWG